MADSNQIHSALQSLVPHTIDDQHPARLVNLANSLLAQSQLRAPNLKPEEEIARAYGCCEIAVKRLQAVLKLDLAKARPPCKPGVYKKLLGFLEGALRDVGTPRRSRTAQAGEDTSPMARRGANRARDTPTKAQPERATSSRPGSSRRQQVLQKRTNDAAQHQFTGTVENSSHVSKGKDTDESPNFTMPLIRHLCSHLSVPKTVAPHAYTGSSVIMKQARLWPLSSNSSRQLLSSKKRKSQVDHEDGDELTELEETDLSLLALIIAVFLLVLTKMQRGEMTNNKYEVLIATATFVAASKEFLEKSSEEEEEEDSELVRHDQAKEERDDQQRARRTRLKKGVETWIKTISEEEWCEGQGWWDSVPEEVFDLPGPGSLAPTPTSTAVAARTTNYQAAPPEPTQFQVDDDDDDDENAILTKRRRAKKQRTTTTHDAIDPTLDPALLAADPDETNSPAPDPGAMIMDPSDPDGPDAEGVLLPGLGTMMQDAVDFCSRERKVGYARWKETMERRIRMVERERERDASGGGGGVVVVVR